MFPAPVCRRQADHCKLPCLCPPGNVLKSQKGVPKLSYILLYLYQAVLFICELIDNSSRLDHSVVQPGRKGCGKSRKQKHTFDFNYCGSFPIEAISAMIVNVLVLNMCEYCSRSSRRVHSLFKQLPVFEKHPLPHP